MTVSSSPDFRWKQRLQTFITVHEQLKAGIEISKQRSLNDLEKQGLIQSFEYTHELAWNVMKDYFEYQGTTQIRGSRDATREAFQKALITDGPTWMAMIESRNDTSHTYNKKLAEEIVQKIVKTYSNAFADFHQMMTGLSKQ